MQHLSQQIFDRYEDDEESYQLVYADDDVPEHLFS